MANRTNEDLVASIIDVGQADDVNPYITTANQFVTELCTTSGYDTTRLELIERWLAAHFFDVNRGRAIRGAVYPGPSEDYEPVKVDLFFNNTKYGQQAVLLDTAGNLAALQNAMEDVKKPLAASGPARTRWLGKPLC